MNKYDKLGDTSPFSGRVRRHDYIMNAIVIPFAVTLVASIILFVLAYYAKGAEGIILIGGLGSLILVLFFMTLPITVRRFHDRDMSGWWVLIFMLLSPICGVAALVEIVILCFLEGTVGDNKYGPDPKASEHMTKIKAFNLNGEHAPATPIQALNAQKEDLEKKLVKLDNLHANGVVPEKSYEEQRKKILEKITKTDEALAKEKEAQAAAAQPQTPNLATAQNNSDPAARLKKLESLHSQGLISDTEYESQRKQIIASV